MIGGGIGALKQRDSLLRAADHALVWVCALLALATIGLTSALADGDLALRYVAEHVTLNLSPAYRAAALWTGDAGRWLFFAFVLAALIVLALRGTHTAARWQAPAGAMAVLCAIAIGVSGAPFARLAWRPSEGSGMVPALQSPLVLAIAPVTLASCAALVVVAVLALEHGRPERVARWLLAAWLGESVAIALGLRALERLDAPVWRSATAYWLLGLWAVSTAVIGYPRLRQCWWPRARRARQLLMALVGIGALLLVGGAVGRTRVASHTLSLGQGQSASLRDRMGRAWTFSQQGVSAYRAGDRDVVAVTLEGTRSGARGVLLVAQRSQFVDSRAEALGAPVATTASAHGPLQSVRVALLDVAPNDVAQVRVEFVLGALWFWFGGAAILAAGFAAWLIALRRA